MNLIAVSLLIEENTLELLDSEGSTSTSQGVASGGDPSHKNDCAVEELLFMDSSGLLNSVFGVLSDAFSFAGNALANPGVGNLLLLIAAVIGVYGSYYLYNKRLNDRREAMRRALKAEMESAFLLDTMIRKGTVGDEVPSDEIHPTTVYEATVDEIGLLTDKEIGLITEFYSSAIATNKSLEWHRELTNRINLSSDYIDRGESERKKAISSQIKNIAIRRWKALQTIKKNLGEDYEPIEKMDIPESAGETVSKDHPLFWDQPNESVIEGYFSLTKPESDMYELTEKGEEWFKDRDSDEMYDLDHDLSLR